MAKDRRPKKIEIRVHEHELLALRERSTRPELGRWLRELGLGEAPPPRARRKARTVAIDPALMRQLAGLTNNLNQLTRRAYIEGLREHSDLMMKLDELKSLIERVASDDR